MAEEAQEEQPQPESEPMEFVGMSDVLALHADAFFVLQNGDNFTLYFFQHEIPPLRKAIARTEPLETRRSKCIARMAVSPLGFINLTRALVQHAAQAGLIQTPPDTEPENEERQ